MQIEELYHFLNWVDKEIRKKNLPKKYQELHGILQRNAQPNQKKESFENQKDDLINTVTDIQIQELNDAQVRFAQKTGLWEFVGEHAKEKIEDILFRNVIDIATAAGKIGEIHSQLNNILSKIQQITSGLKGYVDEDLIEYEEALLHIRFSGKSSISDISNFKKWGNAWYEIGRGIAMLHGESPEHFRVIGTKRGSIIYDLAVCYAIAKTISSIILLGLRVTERCLEIRKKTEELRGMKLSNDKATIELEKEAKQVEAKGQQDIVDKIMKSEKGDGEVRNALEKSVQRLLEFLKGGGEVDVTVKAQADGEDHEKEDEKTVSVINQIKKAHNEIRKIENKIRLLDK